MVEQPAWMLALPDQPEWRGGLKARLLATYGRIADRVRDEEQLARERIAALEWCRANGNPHKKHPR